MTTPHQSGEEKEVEDIMDIVEQEEDSAETNEEEGDPGAVFFEVEKILAEERSETDGQLYYKIRWLGYTSDDDSLEPAHEIQHCVEIVAAWEAEKARKAEQKRLKRAKSGDESGSTSSRNKKRSRNKQPTTSSKRTRVAAPEDDDSDASRGTADSYMNELKSKNEGTYAWEDVQPRKPGSISDSDDDTTTLAEKERQQRKSKRKVKPSAVKTKPSIKAPAKAMNQPKTPIESQNAHFPFMKRSMDSIKPAKRKSGQLASTVRADDRRSKPMSYGQMSTIKKKQGQEPPPDASAIAVFRPDAVLTATAKKMKTGMGYEKAVGDIDTVISLTQRKETSFLERKETIIEKPRLTNPLGRRPSVTEALARAAKITSEATARPREKSMSPIISPVKSPVAISDTMEDVDTAALQGAWLKTGPASPIQVRRASFSSTESSRPPRPLPPRRNSSTGFATSPISDSFPNSAIDVLPSVAEDVGRTWTGELLYSKDSASFGTIRLLIPQSSTRIKKLPTFSAPSLHLSKLISASYLSKRWFSATAHPSKKPECLVVEFQNNQAQKTFADILKNTDSSGVVLENSCILIFFLKYNDRLRPLFNGDASSGPIGVALLHETLNIPEYITNASKADELLTGRRMPYNGILLSESLDSYIPHMKGYPYVLHSPSESLETDEIENVLSTRGHMPSPQRDKAKLVLIHRLYQPCLNYIPRLTEHKRRNADILLFGSYLDFEMIGNSIKPVFGSGITRIFPNAGKICFTMDHLLENPQHIKSILMYNNSRSSWSVVLPITMTEKLDKFETSSVANSENTGDILLAVALLREHLAAKKVLTEDYRLNDVGVNSYMPFMNFLQNREYETVRRFLLIHPRPVSGGQWDVAGNGIEVYTPQQFDIHFKVTR